MTAMLKSAALQPVTARPGSAGWPLSHVTPPVRALVESPAMMRPYIRAVLAEWGMRAMSVTAELVTTELVTNVVLAPVPDDQDDSREDRVPVFQLGMFSDRRLLLIEVFDTVPGEPRRQEAAADDESGRGLAIVEALSEGQWGTRPHPRGKVVYARLRVT